ncbi:helix-turn-helix domain-containing protein [Mucilaginibacter gracilis]|uniref:helix-turn-helix domain-containing protein n=1 Tax=Mucilaginibacter gracilis TaxID=423350 RepID=UPI0021D35A44|nr:helix-turn-helix domain-containing protein [Mucilaginibacter gracilis]
MVILKLPSEVNYQWYIDETISLNISRANLANMAGIAEENVIRLLKEFKTEGILVTDERKIIIKDVIPFAVCLVFTFDQQYCDNQSISAADRWCYHSFLNPLT